MRIQRGKMTKGIMSFLNRGVFLIFFTEELISENKKIKRRGREWPRLIQQLKKQRRE
jgi:hypothetical protein